MHSGNLICRFLSIVKKFLIPVGPHFIQNVFTAFLVFPCTLLPGLNFTSCDFGCFARLSSPGKLRNQMCYKVIFEAIAAVKFTAFSSEILSNMKSIDQNFGGWRLTPYRSQWPCSLRYGLAAACLLVLWVRIPLGHGYLSLVSVVYCQVEVCPSG
jgi:hypothetical protein